MRNFNYESILADIDRLEEKAKATKAECTDRVFNDAKFETIKRLVQADATINLVQLEQRLKVRVSTRL